MGKRWSKFAGDYAAVCPWWCASIGQQWKQDVGNTKAFSKLLEDPLSQGDVSLVQEASTQHLTTHCTVSSFDSRAPSENPGLTCKVTLILGSMIDYVPD